MSVDKEGVKSIEKLPIPISKKKLQSLLGLYNYCSKFIEGCHKIISPLFDIIRLKGEKEKSFWRNAERNKRYIKESDEKDRFINYTECHRQVCINDGCVE